MVNNNAIFVLSYPARATKGAALNIADLVLARADDDAVGLRAGEQSWTYREYVDEAIARAHVLLSHRPDDKPFHIGVLLENVPDYVFLLGAAAITGGAIVGINPTRRGSGLERDIRHTECAVLVTEEKFLPLLDGLDTGVSADATYVIESDRWRGTVQEHAGRAAPSVEIDEAAPFLLIFTSGTSGEPKASICSQSRLAGIAPMIARNRQITSDDTLYSVMPFFHANGIMSGWSAALAGGATLAIRRRFSASQFMPDVRKYGATLANYVGKVIAYVLATPESPEDRENPLRFVYGNEGGALNCRRFEERFGCPVSDSYGSSEGGVSIFATPDTPPGALGQGVPGSTVLDPDTGQPKDPAVFTAHGRLANPDEAIGEIARIADDLEFEGYWNDPEAQQEKTRGGIFWTGDLGYRDEAGFLYLLGRNSDWMRVDGENMAAVTIEGVMARFPSAALVCAYGVPDVDVGDQIMLAILLRDGENFEPQAFARFLREQPDLGTKALPRYVRICEELPMTSSNKILTRQLRAESWDCPDPVWLRDGDGYRLMTIHDITTLRNQFEARGRGFLLEYT